MSAEDRSVQRISRGLSIAPLFEARLHLIISDEPVVANIIFGFRNGLKQGNFLAYVSKVGILRQPLDRVKDLFFYADLVHRSKLHDLRSNAAEIPSFPMAPQVAQREYPPQDGKAKLRDKRLDHWRRFKERVVGRNVPLSRSLPIVVSFLVPNCQKQTGSRIRRSPD